MPLWLNTMTVGATKHPCSQTAHHVMASPMVPSNPSWFVDSLSGSGVLCNDLSRERGSASVIATVSSSVTTAHEYKILTLAECKVASFQLQPNEIPFQPLEWPGDLQQRGPRQYNDAWHNSTTVPQPVPRKPHNMCHCALCFAAQPRCLALAWDTKKPDCAAKLTATWLVRQVQRIARWRTRFIRLALRWMC